MKQNATIDIDEFEQDTANIINDLHTLGREWENTRKTHTGAELIGLLGATTIDILDSIAGIVSCSNNNCPELCHEEWDFCKKHGEEPSSKTMSPALEETDYTSEFGKLRT